ncbi:MAG: AAA family ATPase [Nitrospinae bacterium]|nr:AAA family ATPase [Nitrospinota bacterium]
MEKVKDGESKVEVSLSKEQVEKVISEKYSTLTQGQKDAVEHICTSQDRVVGVQGDAGTGKTAMLNVVREELQDKGYEVVGLAKTGKAADELYKGAGIQSQTIDSFLQRGLKAEDRGQKTENISQKLFVVDEASMVGSRKMHEVLTAAEKVNARVVLVGDTKQLQSIEAGNIFQKLQESGVIKTVEMKEILRQKTEEYKDIVKAVSEKEIDTAFEKLEAGKKIEEIGNREDRITAIVKDYTGRKDYKDTLVVTGFNKDRNEINSAIREELKTQGKLQGEEYSFTVRESKGLNSTEKHFAQSYDAGEIVFINKAGAGGIRAGAEAMIVEVNQQEHKIKVQGDKGEIREIDLKKDGEDIERGNL